MGGGGGGGGAQKAHDLAREAYRRNQTDNVPVTHRHRVEWYGVGALKQHPDAMWKYAGGNLSDSTKHNYEGHFRKWGIYRGVDNMIHHITDSPGDADKE